MTNLVRKGLAGIPRLQQRARLSLYRRSFDEVKRDRKALVVVSHGGDNASKASLEQVLKLAEQSNAMIYTIGIFDEDDPDKNTGALTHLARATGGAAFFPHQLNDVVDICEGIARDIRNQYTIGYVPTNTKRNDSYRAIRVVARTKDPADSRCVPAPVTSRPARPNEGCGSKKIAAAGFAMVPAYPIRQCRSDAGILRFIVLDARIFEQRQTRNLERLLRDKPVVSGPAQQNAPAISAKKLPAIATEGLIGKIEIPRLGLSAVFIEGTGSATLRRAAGHIPGTALPGEPGNLGIAGHRDTFFRPLRNIHLNDIITLTTLRGEHYYRDVCRPSPHQVYCSRRKGDDW